ncbi:MAG: hypothetical protein WCF33_21585 [Pseudonocardiaceae bacterium]
MDNSWTPSQQQRRSSIESDQPGTGVHILTIKHVPELDSQVMPGHAVITLRGCRIYLYWI